MPDAVGKVAVLRTGREEEDRERIVLEQIAAKYGISVEQLEEALVEWADGVFDRELGAASRYAVDPHLALVKG